MHVFAQNAVNIGVFEEVVQKHYKNTAFWTCCVVKVSQIAVFLLRWLFWLLQEHRKYQCFGSFLGLRG